MCQLKTVTPGCSLGKRNPNFIPLSPKKLKVQEREEENNPNHSNSSNYSSQSDLNVCPTAPAKPTINLIQAARVGNLDVIKQLIEAGEDVNQEIVGCTALHYAVFYNRKEVVEYLISAGANVDAQNPSGLTPLAWAVDRGYSAIAWILLEACADPRIGDKQQNTPLHCAAKLNDHEMVETLLSINTDEEQWTDPNAHNNEGFTPLHFAAMKGSTKIIQILLDFGANINAVSSRNISPLHRAVSANQLETVKFLVEKGADINFTDNLGRSSVYLAANGGFIEILQFLLEQNAEIKSDKFNVSPIQKAKLKGFTEIMEVLSAHEQSNN